MLESNIRMKYPALLESLAPIISRLGTLWGLDGAWKDLRVLGYCATVMR